MDNINITKLIDEVINEMQNSKVDSDIILYMKMNINTLDDFTPVLNLNNKELLYSKIIEYIYKFKNSDKFLNSDEQELYVKRVIALLFADMSINDFNDPVLYVQRKIDFIDNKLLEDKTIHSDYFEGDIIIEINPYGKETPYSFDPIIVDDNDSYVLPIISYGISEGVCYIYAIQDYNEHEKTKYHDKIKRKLYKLNSGVYEDESIEYKDYKEGKSEYYPENISDVPPSFILSLTLFLNEIYKNGITKVNVVPYLPIRYANKIKVIARKVLRDGKKQNLNNMEKKNMFLELVDKQRYIQSNITEKFIRCFYRMNYHFTNVSITSLPMELDDSLHISLGEFIECNNEILDNMIKESNKNLSK
ncbi:MAG: hypothetical protein J6B98_05125 [Bacilli bacterium]|nr:hypothetical protein [Bacilli bacterium]